MAIHLINELWLVLGTFLIGFYITVKRHKKNNETNAKSIKDNRDAISDVFNEILTIDAIAEMSIIIAEGNNRELPVSSDYKEAHRLYIAHMDSAAIPIVKMNSLFSAVKKRVKELKNGNTV